MGRVYVTGLGVVSPIALGTAAFRDALDAGVVGAAEVQSFEHESLDRHIACEVKGFRPRDFLTAAEARHAGRCSAMTLAAARMAVEHSGLGGGALEGERTSVIVGTTMGEANVLGELQAAWIHDGDHAVTAAKLPRYGTTLLPIHVARAFGARGMVQTLPAACAAGNYAIGYAADQIRAGRADVVITGAAEVIEKLQYAGFARIGAMSPDFCRPFDSDRRGLLVGEGAGIVVLESEAHLVARGGTPLAEIGGYGLACDAHHITRPHPEGKGSRYAMEQAIATSLIEPKDVDLINAHGTGTQANDLIEAKVIGEIFGQHKPAVTSIKSMIGHCMGAASAIEAVSCVLSVLEDRIPPTVNVREIDTACSGIDLVRDHARDRRCSIVLNNSLAFGGYDAVTVIAKPGVLPGGVGEA